MTITDPPYESLERHRAKGTTTRLKQSKSSSNEWFQSFPNVSYWPLFKWLYHVHKANTHMYMFCDNETEHVVLSGCNPFDTKSDEVLAEEALKQVYEDHMLAKPHAPWAPWPSLTWVKTKIKNEVDDAQYLSDDDISTGMGYHWRRSEERILFMEKGKRKLNNNSFRNVLCGRKANRKEYPTQKPEAILRKLVQNSGVENGILLDPFAGSGTVAQIAKEEFNMRSILIDIASFKELSNG